MGTKILAVLGQKGAGKKTLVGNLLYKCGLDLSLLQRLESSTDRKYVDVVSFFEQNGIAKAFYASSDKIIVSDSMMTPHIAVWVVDVSSTDRGAASSAELASLISSGTLKPKEKLDRVDWSKPVFNETASSFQGISLQSTDTYIIPVSALHGDNLLELPDVSWFNASSGKTVLQALG